MSGPKRGEGKFPGFERLPRDLLLLLHDKLFSGTPKEQLRSLDAIEALCRSHARLNQLLCADEPLWQDLIKSRFRSYSKGYKAYFGPIGAKEAYRRLLELTSDPERKTEAYLDAWRREDDKAMAFLNSELEYDHLWGFLEMMAYRLPFRELVKESIAMQRPDLITVPLERGLLDDFLASYLVHNSSQENLLLDILTTTAPENEAAAASIVKALLSRSDAWTPNDRVMERVRRTAFKLGFAPLWRVLYR